MKNEIRIDQEQRQRLTNSLSVLLPRVDAITAEFCQLVETAAPSLRLFFPSDERLIAPVLEQLISTAGQPDDAAALLMGMGEHGSSMGITIEHLPTLLAAIQTAIADVAGYTWTDALEHDWTQWFDALAGWALRGAERGAELAA